MRFCKSAKDQLPRGNFVGVSSLLSIRCADMSRTAVGDAHSTCKHACNQHMQYATALT